MAPITTISFRRNGQKYDVEMNLDDQAIMDGSLKFEVVASVTNSERQMYKESLALELDLEGGEGRIFHERSDEPLYVFSLWDVPVLMDQGVESPPGMETDDPDAIDGVSEFVDEGIGRAVSDLIDRMPTPDPILGCALKAGISSLLGQTLTCNEMVDRNGTTRSRTWQIVRCLKDHVGGLFTRTLWRAARCMVGLGIF